MPDSTQGPAGAPPPHATARALAHVSLAVPDAEAAARRFGELLGATVRSRETLPERGLYVVFLQVAGVPLELVQPLDPADPANPVAKFLEARGPGLHHLAFFVDDAASALAHARSRGARLVDESPRPGAGGSSVAFLHPSAASGVLVELVEGGARAPDPPG